MSHSVSHGSEVLFVYGLPPNATLSSATLSLQIIDYWISFATSLDPNDGRGSLRMLSSSLMSTPTDFFW
jgi:hypothetical protein